MDPPHPEGATVPSAVALPLEVVRESRKSLSVGRY